MSPGACVELLEREQCFADLNDWLASSVEQGGCVTLVHGEAGIGKTALLQEFSRQQRAAPRVLWGACDALFTPRPLAPLHDIARQTQGKLLAAVNAETSRDAIFIAALDELEHGPPALVVFEDCHWADEATFDLLKFLGRRSPHPRNYFPRDPFDDRGADVYDRGSGGGIFTGSLLWGRWVKFGRGCFQSGNFTDGV